MINRKENRRISDRGRGRKKNERENDRADRRQKRKDGQTSTRIDGRRMGQKRENIY